MNIADSEKIHTIFLQSGFKVAKNPKDADIVIFNTCSVRKKGEDRVFGLIQEILKFSKKNNKKIIIGITGCMSRKTGINPKYFKDKNLEIKSPKNIELLKDEKGIFNSDDKLFAKTKDKIDFITRIEEISYLPKILSVIFKKDIGKDFKSNDYLKIRQLQENPASANIIIQIGCDNFCSYCIVPYTRGREFSRKKEDILIEIKNAIKNGSKEIVLIGQNVNSYGKQLKKKLWNLEKSSWNSQNIKTPFRKLLEEINKIKGLDRIRFTSSNPHDMTQDILNAHFDLDKTCNYLHFALQSGDDEILKAMNRKHTYSDFKSQVKYLRSRDPLFAISTDIIVGFPGETESQFQKTVKAFKELDFDFAYIARYSPRPGTFAYKNLKDDITLQEKARRWNILNDLLKKSVQKRAKLMIGREEEILIYGIKKGLFFGRTRNFKEVFIKKDGKIKIGDIVKVKITKLDGWVLRGEKI
ncbi:MiaB/RimO family radical SAM methylthiotransferase [Candidatus Gracilibacteria bacterium]|nr:MiaB/RimO family radical SAM methylthiotransferase [Candidatus Gracilibacteria bacterium]